VTPAQDRGDEQGGSRPAQLSRPYAAPRNATEITLAGIWRDLTGWDSIGIDDDFLELGGHSLLAIQALTRIGAAFGVKLSLQEFLSAPTVAGLAEKILEVKGGHGPGEGKLAELAASLDQYSEEDIRKIVAESRARGPGQAG
jgi:acyl carrier protein